MEYIVQCGWLSAAVLMLSAWIALTVALPCVAHRLSGRGAIAPAQHEALIGRLESASQIAVWGGVIGSVWGVILILEGFAGVFEEAGTLLGGGAGDDLLPVIGAIFADVGDLARRALPVPISTLVGLMVALGCVGASLAVVPPAATKHAEDEDGRADRRAD